MGRDTLQRVFEVIKTRKGLERAAGVGKVAVEELANYYKNSINLAASSEPVSRTFVENVNQVEKLMLKSAPCLKLLAKITEAWGRAGPLQSIYKLQAILVKANKTPDLITWCVATIYDLCKSGSYQPGEISAKALKDGAGGNRALVDLWVFKKQLRDYLTLVDLPKRARAPEMKTPTAPSSGPSQMPRRGAWTSLG